MLSLANLAGVAILLSVYGMIAARQLGGLVGLYRLQSVCLAVAASALAWDLGHPHLWLTAALTLIFKVGVIPWLLTRLVHEEVHEKRELSFHLNTPAALVLGAGLGVFGFFVAQSFGANPLLQTAVEMGLAVFLLGLFLVTLRREALAQVIGLLVAENGGLLMTMAILPTLSSIAEISVFFDVVLGVLVMGLLIRRMHETLKHTDTNLLKELRG